ncbi:hypothetical protein [Azotosporobacter soli]|uniref:hypothetical protein n=1 Tax=Azotosporobacter soli TaxID=3055040 RepID=UPI0031FE8673
MRLWQWFCQLGRQSKEKKKDVICLAAEEKAKESGADICSQLCGSSACRCGGSARGFYCIWTYYRVK